MVVELAVADPLVGYPEGDAARDAPHLVEHVLKSLVLGAATLDRRMTACVSRQAVMPCKVLLFKE